ncbi:purine nucleoside permease [Aestuariibacter sp. A3R04]|uniref:purine nucleoside permease n=1 Tax=Aestuariibacter sp. A3R04 TaxID=2841571 RepID=UPI0020908620|nr:purine nucleoside permease [Aestuariibacter sp. A3R04]
MPFFIGELFVKALFTFILLYTGCYSSTFAAPLKVKAVVVTMFEIGEDEGDKAGEFQMWKTRYGLTTRYPLPHGFHDIYANDEKGVLAIVTGMGTARASAAIMALGLDDRFDLTQAYWLVAGIAGMDPQDGTIGSAVWTRHLVDGDLAHEIDAREIPESWPTGYFPLFSHSPYPAANGTQKAHNGEMYTLNTSLAQWAYYLTKDIELMETEAMASLRARYKKYPNAQTGAKVMIGDHLAAATFWHGKKMNDWANAWVKFWVGDDGNFITSGMEDTGSFQAMQYLHNAGLVDKNRFMVLRTASNFTMQPHGLTAAENLKLESSGAGYAGMVPSLEAAYKVGSTVINEIVENWHSYQKQIPAK